MRQFAYACVLTCLPTLAFAQTAQEEEDKGFLTNLIEENLSGVSRAVTITGFEGALSSAATLDRLTIADAEGIWLTLEDVVLDWNRSALLRGRIDINELSAVRIIVARAPISEASDVPSPEAQPFSLPELPVSIALDQLQIDRIELGESFLGEPVNISLTGNAALANGEGNANVTATRLDTTDGSFVVDGSYSNDTSNLSLNLDVNEGADGIAARLLDLPDRPSTELTVSGEGPLATFAADIGLATDGQSRIAGRFAFTEEDETKGFALDIGGDLTPLLDTAYQDFFGTDVALIAEGRQLADGRFDVSQLDLRAQRLRLSGGALIGAEGWPERINLSGDISDPTGDVVLLPLSGPQTFVENVDLDISYNQAISEDWTAEFILDSFDRPGLFISKLALSGGGILRPGEGDQTGAVTADLRYTATGLELDDPGTAQAFGDDISGVIQASRIEDLPTEIDRITIRGPGLEADATGTINTRGSGIEIDSKVALNVAALSRFSTLAGRQLAGSADVTVESTVDPLNGLYNVTVDGGTKDLRVDIAQVDPLLTGDGTIDILFVRDTEGTRLEAFDIATDEATITADADITSTGSDARFDAQIRDIAVIEPDLSGPVTLAGTVTQAAEGVIIFDIDGAGPDATISADGNATPMEAGFSVDADIVADMRDLTTYATLAGRPLDGAIDATLSGVLLTDGLLFDGEMSARTTDLVTGIADLDPLLAGTGTISVDLARNSDTAYVAKDLQMRLPEVRLDADADVDLAGPIDATFDLRLTDVGLVVDGVSGPVTAQGTALRGPDNIVQIDIAATAPGVTADVDVAVTAQNEVSGTVSATIAELADYADLIDQPVAGAVSTNVAGSLLPDLSAFDLTLDLTTDDLETGIAQADILLEGRGRVSATAARTVDGISVPLLRVLTPQMNLDASLFADAAGNGRGVYDAKINDIGLIARGLNGPVTAKGTADQAADGTWAVLSDLTAPGATAKADIAIAPDTTEISGTVTAAINELAGYQPLIGQQVSGGVTATVTGQVLPDLTRFGADIAVQTRDLGVGNTTADLLLRGLGNLDLTAARTADGIKVTDLDLRTNNVTVTGNLDTTNSGVSQGKFEARLRDVGLLTDQLSGPVTATGTASVGANGTIGIDIDGTGPGGIAVAADGTIASTGNLNIDASGVIPLELANAALEPRRINGNANFDLSINGPAALNAVSGQVTVNGARLAAPTLGQALNDISGRVGLSNGRAQVDIAGNVQAGGSVVISGPVGLTGNLQSDLSVALNDVILRDPELYETSVDGTITVRGPLTGGAPIVGRLNLGQTDIQVPSSGVGSLGDLPDVIHIGETGAVAQTRTRAGATSGDDTAQSSGGSGGGAVFPLDIVVNAPSRIFIRGRGLDAELGGSLSLGGTSANIIPVGQFSLIRGRLDILQQRFDLSEGVASLQGDFSPYLRLVAVTEARTGTTVRIIVEGPADAPEVTFESTPQLPQDEVLAQLIFGRDISEISPLQAVQLAAAVGTLAGRGGGGLINGFREDIGLDDFDVTTDADGNAAVRAGAYLSENVYTDVTINALGETEVNLNLDITDEISAKGTVDQDGETSLGVFFERDY